MSLRYPVSFKSFFINRNAALAHSSKNHHFYGGFSQILQKKDNLAKAGNISANDISLQLKQEGIEGITFFCLLNPIFFKINSINRNAALAHSNKNYHFYGGFSQIPYP